MQTKFRNGKEQHEIRWTFHDRYFTWCGWSNRSPFRAPFAGKVTCLQCIEAIERKERTTK